MRGKSPFVSACQKAGGKCQNKEKNYVMFKMPEKYGGRIYQ